MSRLDFDFDENGEVVGYDLGKPPLSDQQIRLGELLNELAAFVRRFLICSENQAIVLAVYIAHTYAIDAAEATPYLHVTSPLRRSGKSRLLDLLALLVRKPQKTANMTPPAIFRTIAAYGPTLLWDEVDATFGPKANGSEDLRALLNAGYRRGTPVLRCVGDGAKMRVEPFEVFCPKVLAGIGRLPDTIADRSIPIALKRRMRDEHVDRFREKRASSAASPLRKQLEQWAEEAGDILATAEPELPDALDDRAQDVCEPLIAIADLAGGDWPTRVRQALVELRGDSDAADDSARVQLLADIHSLFDRLRVEKIFSALLVSELGAVILPGVACRWRGCAR